MKRVLALLLITVSCVGCAASKATLNTYVDPNFGRGSIQSIAVFPIRNASFAPSEARQINRKISQAIHEKNAEIQIIGSAEASQALNDNDTADDWAIFVANYSTSGIPDAVILADIGSILEVDAIIQGEIVNIFQQDGTYGGNKGTTRVTVRFSMLGTESGSVLWEASSDGIKGTATTLESAPPVIEAVNLAVDKIIANIPL